MTLALMTLVGCVSASVASLQVPVQGSIKLRFTSDLACPAALGPSPLTFLIDEAADEDVLAIDPDGTLYQVWWSKGFVGGMANDPVVRDPDGLVVARNGEVFQQPTLHGYPVCFGSDTFYILLAGMT